MTTHLLNVGIPPVLRSKMEKIATLTILNQKHNPVRVLHLWYIIAASAQSSAGTYRRIETAAKDHPTTEYPKQNLWSSSH